MRSQNVYSLPTKTGTHQHTGMSIVHLDEYELWQTARRLSPLTVTERTRVLAQFNAETGVQPAHAQPVDIMRWMTSHPEWSQGTSCTYYAYLNGWYKFLQAQDLRVDNPLVKIGAPKTPERLPRPVSDNDVRALMMAPVYSRTRAMISLACLQGLRVGEIAKVRAEDIHLERRTLTVKGKGGSLHDLPLHPRIAELAWSMPRRGWWFPAPVTRPGQHVRPGSVSQAISGAMDRCGIRATPHALRHWFASKILAGSGDIYLVRDLLRHKNISTTVVYAKLPDAHRRDAIDRLDPWGTPAPHLVSAA